MLVALAVVAAGLYVYSHTTCYWLVPHDWVVFGNGYVCRRCMRRRYQAV